MTTKRYVNAIVFCGLEGSPFKYVILNYKTHPAWQKDKLNGVGGKIEPGETDLQAMEREWIEETGLILPDVIPFTKFAILRGPEVYDQHPSVNDFEVVFYVGIISNTRRINTGKGIGSWFMQDNKPAFEAPFVCNTRELPNRVIPNLTWLTPMAISVLTKEGQDYLDITESYNNIPPYSGENAKVGDENA